MPTRAAAPNAGSKLLWLAAGAIIAALAVWWVAAAQDGPSARGRIGLFTPLPLLWRESDSVAGQLTPAAPRWAAAVLRDSGEVVPLDALAGTDGGNPLAGSRRLVMAQPKPLAPAENVALDDWVRAGGELLLFADPALTEDSAFGLADKRRPPDAVMLSPILTRWGLELKFDEAQPYGERVIDVSGTALPVNLPGTFAAAAPTCRIAGEGVIAICRIGRGRVTAVADAAVLEQGGDDTRHAALRGLLRLAFAPA